MNGTHGPPAASTDWGVSRAKGPGVGRPLAILLLPILLVALILVSLVDVYLGLIFGTLALIAAGSWLGTAGRRLRRRTGAHDPPEDGSRIRNLVDGLSSDLAMKAPKVWVVNERQPGAFTLWDRGGNLGVTQGLLEDFTRTETEAVVAHCLVRLRDEKAVPTWLTALGGLGLKLPTVDHRYLDAKAVAVTRYPPALASALEKAGPADEGSSLLWFGGEDARPDARKDRITALRDL